ncbi:MAG: hypothetical protein HQK51_15530 [Oligoflexia bacterium]|nr:hypothetical protein [Oligoflexia bacterium]
MTVIIISTWSNKEIIAKLDANTNTVIIEKSIPYLKVLLRQRMLDLNLPIKISIDGHNIFEIKVEPNVKTMARTLLDRGDSNYIFDVAILIEKIGNQWKISQSE